MHLIICIYVFIYIDFEVCPYDVDQWMFKGDPSQELFSSFPVIFQISYDIQIFYYPDDNYSGPSQVLKISIVLLYWA